MQLADKNCSIDTPATDCPINSVCSLQGNATKCICNVNYELNSAWQFAEPNATHEVLYCKRQVNSTPNVPAETTEENKVVYYIRTTSNTQHLGFAIVMVLLFAILSTAFCYVLKVLRPVKRTKKFYRKMRYQRNNVRPLQEFDEIDLERRNDESTFK